MENRTLNVDGEIKQQEVHKRTVCVVGHKNPDTDSICSAISYAYLKNQLGTEYNYVPARAGQISAETQYVLERFQVEPPLFLENIGTRVKDMEIRKVAGVRSNISLKDADDNSECIYPADYDGGKSSERSDYHQ